MSTTEAPRKWEPWRPATSAFPPLTAKDKRLSFDYMFEHRDEWRELCLKIRTKAHGLQPFVRNHTQRAFRSKVQSLREQGIPPRIIVLKSRQVGISTEVESDIFEETYFESHRTGLVLAHTKPAASNLLRMSRLLYDALPDELKKPVAKVLRNVHEIELSNGSRMQVEAVGEVRSYSAQMVHLSEFAFYDNPVDTLISIMQSVPDSPNSLAVIESTANGVGNKFHEMWINAIRGESDEKTHPAERGWVPLFVAWFEHEEYTRWPNFTAKDLTADELALARRYHLRLGQIAWRRWCIRVNCDGDEERFNVEYPSTWQEAFALSGRPVFDAKALQVIRSEVDPDSTEARAKTLHHVTRAVEVSWDAEKKCAVFDHVSGGRLRIYKPVHPRHTYIIGVDPSEGDPKSDPSPIEVLDQMGSNGKLEQVAEFWGRVPPDILADFSAWLGWYYNRALVIGEGNNQGIFYHAHLLNWHNYPNVYFRTVNEETVAGQVTDKPGYWETNKSKHALFDTGRKAIREQKLTIYSPGLLSELETAIYDRKEGFSKTKIKPQPGHQIDRVMSLLMALYAHRSDVNLPLLPLKETEIVSARERMALERARDPEHADTITLDLFGVTAADLDRHFEDLHRSKMLRESQGSATER